ncbi:Protein containing a metal-binding domain shared with formylmethanofuran dehydrogenase subunit E [Methanophagales archaeon]|nr:Protein containing a metal-binding domain shared with formylmethanofuran dehydrogenase subunit E [Methanophagales archaeon]
MNKKSSGKKQVALVLSIVAMAILISAAGLAVAENDSVCDCLGQRAAEVAKEELPFVMDDPNILAMTDSGYAIVGGKVGGTTTEECIDSVIASSGCTLGNGNLLLVHRSKEKPLWFAFFNKSSGECVYLEVDSSVFDMTAADVTELLDDEVFTKIAKVNIGADELFANPESWPKVFGGNEFTIVTFANVWADDAPYEFMKAAEFHNHICPGLTSGYMIIEYLDENLPLQGNQNYEIIACPPWCKDDAFQVIFDKTVGKRFVAMHLTEEDEEQLPDNVAGIYIRWDGATNTGDGLVLAFNWTKASEASDIPDSFKDYRSIRKLKMDLEMMNYLGQPETFVTVVKEFDINSEAELMELKYAGNNPYEVLGLMEPYPLQEEAQRLIDFTWGIHDNTEEIADNETLSKGVKTTAEKIHVISHTLLHTAQYINDYNLEALKDLTKDPESNAAEINDTIFTIREYLGEYKNALDDAHELTDVLEGIVPDSHRAYAGATHDAIHNAEGSVFAILQLIEQLEEGL